MPQSFLLLSSAISRLFFGDAASCQCQLWPYSLGTLSRLPPAPRKSLAAAPYTVPQSFLPLSSAISHLFFGDAASCQCQLWPYSLATLSRLPPAPRKGLAAAPYTVPQSFLPLPSAIHRLFFFGDAASFQCQLWPYSYCTLSSLPPAPGKASLQLLTQCHRLSCRCVLLFSASSSETSLPSGASCGRHPFLLFRDCRLPPGKASLQLLAQCHRLSCRCLLLSIASFFGDAASSSASASCGRKVRDCASCGRAVRYCRQAPLQHPIPVPAVAVHSLLPLPSSASCGRNHFVLFRDCRLPPGKASLQLLTQCHRPPCRCLLLSLARFFGDAASCQCQLWPYSLATLSRLPPAPRKSLAAAPYTVPQSFLPLSSAISHLFFGDAASCQCQLWPYSLATLSRLPPAPRKGLAAAPYTVPQSFLPLPSAIHRLFFFGDAASFQCQLWPYSYCTLSSLPPAPGKASLQLLTQCHRLSCRCVLLFSASSSETSLPSGASCGRHPFLLFRDCRLPPGKASLQLLAQCHRLSCRCLLLSIASFFGDAASSSASASCGRKVRDCASCGRAVRYCRQAPLQHPIPAPAVAVHSLLPLPSSASCGRNHFVLFRDCRLPPGKASLQLLTQCHRPPCRCLLLSLARFFGDAASCQCQLWPYSLATLSRLPPAPRKSLAAAPYTVPQSFLPLSSAISHLFFGDAASCQCQLWPYSLATLSRLPPAPRKGLAAAPYTVPQSFLPLPSAPSPLLLRRRRVLPVPAVAVFLLYSFESAACPRKSLAAAPYTVPQAFLPLCSAI